MKTKTSISVKHHIRTYKKEGTLVKDYGVQRNLIFEGGLTGLASTTLASCLSRMYLGTSDELSYETNVSYKATVTNKLVEAEVGSFAEGDVGKYIKFTDNRFAKIVAYTDNTHVTIDRDLLIDELGEFFVIMQTNQTALYAPIGYTDLFVGIDSTTCGQRSELDENFRIISCYVTLRYETDELEDGTIIREIGIASPRYDIDGLFSRLLLEEPITLVYGEYLDDTITIEIMQEEQQESLEALVNGVPSDCTICRPFIKSGIPIYGWEYLNNEWVIKDPDYFDYFAEPSIPGDGIDSFVRLFSIADNVAINSTTCSPTSGTVVDVPAVKFTAGTVDGHTRTLVVTFDNTVQATVAEIVFGTGTNTCLLRIRLNTPITLNNQTVTLTFTKSWGRSLSDIVVSKQLSLIEQDEIAIARGYGEYTDVKCDSGYMFLHSVGSPFLHPYRLGTSVDELTLLPGYSNKGNIVGRSAVAVRDTASITGNIQATANKNHGLQLFNLTGDNYQYADWEYDDAFLAITPPYYAYVDFCPGNKAAYTVLAGDNRMTVFGYNPLKFVTTSGNSTTGVSKPGSQARLKVDELLERVLFSCINSSNIAVLDVYYGTYSTNTQYATITLKARWTSTIATTVSPYILYAHGGVFYLWITGTYPKIAKLIFENDSTITQAWVTPDGTFTSSDELTEEGMYKLNDNEFILIGKGPNASMYKLFDDGTTYEFTKTVGPIAGYIKRFSALTPAFKTVDDVVHVYLSDSNGIIRDLIVSEYPTYELPWKWTFGPEYLTGNGDMILSTGIVPTNEMDWILECTLHNLNSPNTTSAGGCGVVSLSDKCYAYLVNVDFTASCFRIVWGAYLYNSDVTIDTKRHTFEKRGNKMYIDGILQDFELTSVSVITSPLYLFARYAQDENSINGPLYMDIHGFKAWNASDRLTPIAEMLPVTSGSTIYSETPAPSNCFWDTVREEYYEVDDGTLTYGSSASTEVGTYWEDSNPPSLSSGLSQDRLDTGVAPTNSMDWLLDFQIDSFDSGDNVTALFGCAGTTSQAYLLNAFFPGADTGTFGAKWGTTVESSGVTTDLRRHVIEKRGSYFYFDGVQFGAAITPNVETIGGNLHLFGRWSTVNSTFAQNNTQVYQFTAWTDATRTVPLCDMLPVPAGDTRYSATPANSNCMWCTVRSQYYESASKSLRYQSNYLSVTALDRLDTLIMPSAISDFSLHYQLESTNVNDSFVQGEYVGACGVINSPQRAYFLNNDYNSNKVNIVWGTFANWVTGLTLNTKHNVTEKRNLTMIYNNVDYGTANNTVDLLTEPIPLFANISVLTPEVIGSCFPLRIYGLTCWSDAARTTPITNLIPVVKASMQYSVTPAPSNCFWCTVREQYYESVNDALAHGALTVVETGSGLFSSASLSNSVNQDSIDTGIVCKQDMDWVVDCAVENITVGGCIAASIDNTNGNARAYLCNPNTDGTWVTAWGNAAITLNQAVDTSRVYVEKLDTGIYMNGTLRQTISSGNLNGNTIPLHMYANKDSSAIDSYTRSRIYGLIIWSDATRTTKLCHMVPVQAGSTQYSLVPAPSNCMWCIVRQQYYTPKNGTTFIYQDKF